MAIAEDAFALPEGDVELVQRCADGDPVAGDELLARHRAAVADAGPSPTFESVDASGHLALAWVHRDGGTPLPFRATWLALHAQGGLPDADERRNPVWDAFCSLPHAEQTALWHREVEGQGNTEIAAVIGTSNDEVRRLLVAAYAAISSRIEETRSPTYAAASQLQFLQHSLRDVLAGVVLGAAAGRYLEARPRAGERRVVMAPRGRRPHRAAPYVAGLAAASVVAAAAIAAVYGPGPAGPRDAAVPRSAPFEAPFVGPMLWPREQQTSPPGAAPTAGGGGASTNPVLGSAAGSGGQSAGSRGGPAGGAPNAGSRGGSPQGGRSPQAQGQGGGGSATGGPGQGLQHASDQGAEHGVRAHGHKAKGKSKAKSPDHAKSKNKHHGKRKGKDKHHGKGKVRGR